MVVWLVGWGEGGTPWLPSSEMTDLSVLSAGLVLPAHRGGDPLSRGAPLCPTETPFC